MKFNIQAAIHRTAHRYLLRKTAGPLTDVSKLRYQAVFLMGAGGSGKSYVAHKWLKYMPGGGMGGVARKHFDEKVQQEMTEMERSLSNLDFIRAKKDIEKAGVSVELKDSTRASIPFVLFAYDQEGKKTALDPNNWKDELPPNVYQQVKGLEEIVFSTPKHELPTYWRVVNADVYKEELAGYLEEQPGYVHQMSSDMSRAYFEAALETGDPIFVDGTGQRLGKMAAMIKEAKDKGYKVSLVMVIVPLIVNQIRNATRSRKINAPVITKMWLEIAKNFGGLRSSADKSKVIINRNDAVDVKKYWEQKEKIDAHIRKGYGGSYSSLEELIKAIAPSEAREWGPKLGWM